MAEIALRCFRAPFITDFIIRSVMTSVLDMNAVREQMGIESAESVSVMQSLGDGFASADISETWDAEMARRRRDVAEGHVTLVNGNDVFTRALDRYTKNASRP